MLCVVTIACILIPLIASSNDGNIYLLDAEVDVALRSCKDGENRGRSISNRQRRSSYHQTSNANGESQGTNIYAHKRRDTNDTSEKIHILNATDYDYEGYGSGNAGEKLVKDVPRKSGNRTKRHESLVNKPDADQCLSQCVFANLEVVDTRGIPKEPELWSKIQESVTSQQSRAALRDQLRACFQELESEVDGDGCSYSNKLEKCLMLRFNDRKTKGKNTTEISL